MIDARYYWPSHSTQYHRQARLAQRRLLVKEILYISTILILLGLLIWTRTHSGPKIELAEVLIPKAQAEEIKPESQIASWYDYKLGEVWWSKTRRTAASRDYKRGTMLKVTNLENGKSVEVLVNDYGPQARTGRHIDLSSYAFSQIAGLKRGLAKVSIEPINK